MSQLARSKCRFVPFRTGHSDRTARGARSTRILANWYYAPIGRRVNLPPDDLQAESRLHTAPSASDESVRAYTPFVCLLAAACAVDPEVESDATNTAAADFEEIVGLHVDAIRSRDLDGLLATVTSGDSITLIFPNGSVTHTLREYTDFHRRWFADPGWRLDLQPFVSRVHGDFGVALFHSTYSDATGPSHGLVSLTFSRQANGWRLVFDQNTPLADP